MPEFADAVPLPAADGGPNFYGRHLMGQTVGQCPMADLGAIQFEAMQTQRFGGGKAVRARRDAMQPFAQKIQNGLRPRGRVIAAGVAGNPNRSLFMSASVEVSGGESIESAAGDSELIGRLNGF